LLHCNVQEKQNVIATIKLSIVRKSKTISAEDSAYHQLQNGKRMKGEFWITLSIKPGEIEQT